MDSLFKLDDYKIKPWAGGEAKEFFIYPVDSSFEDVNFKILFNEFLVKERDTVLKSFLGYKNYIVPVDSSLVLKKGEHEFQIKVNSTFSFGGDSKLTSLNSVNCVSLLLKEDVLGKLESVKFYNELIIKDDIKKSKILLFYSCDSDIDIVTKKKTISLKKGEAAVYINDDRFEMNIRSNSDENRIIWGKITL